MVPPDEVSISSTAATLPTGEPSSPPPEVTTEEVVTTAQTEAPTSNEPPTTETPTDREEGVGPDRCKEVTVTCTKTDDIPCRILSVVGENAEEDYTVLGTAENTATVEGKLTCQNDGTYSGGTLTEITLLRCARDCT